MDALSANTRFDNLDRDARSQWVDKGKQNQRCMRSATKQAISIKLATTVGQLLRDTDIDFANVNMACPPYFFGLLCLLTTS